MKKYKISVVIPIYNVEKYLEKTIESVINQTIGFKDNIQLILINDGSPDNSEKICLKYQEQYPDNVIYHKKENGGVSSARNKGIELAEGELINFLDSDDLWSNDAFEIAYNAFNKNKNIKLFSTKMVFFDKRKGDHPLNYKYKKDRIVNVLEEYEYPQFSSSSIFIETETVKKYSYTLGIKYSEDNRFINEIVLDHPSIMMLEKPVYYYRKRESGDSAIQSCTTKEDWYTITPTKVYKYLMDLSVKKFGNIIKYIQNIVAYELTWRIALNPKYEIEEKVRKQYEDILKELINNIDDEIFLNQRFMDYATISYILKIKHNENKDILSIEGNKIELKGKQYPLKKLEAVTIDATYIRENKLIAFGKLDRRFISEKDLSIKLNKKDVKINYYDLTNNYNEITFDNHELHDYIGINYEVDLNKDFEMSYYYKNQLIVPSFGKDSYLTLELPCSYHNHGKRTIRLNNNKIINQKRNIFKSFIYEIKNDLYLFKKHKFKPLMARLSIKFRRIFKGKELWLISDRVNKADDNGEHFFKYMVENHQEVNSIFVLSPSSPDYERLKKIGKVIDPNSNKYKLLFGSADYIVSSQAENYVYNPLGTGNECVRDQYNFKYVFLQHGIIKDDLSPWLNVNDKKIDMFVTSAEKEYNSLLECKYYYGKEVVKLTGLPRFDTLLDKQKKYQVENKIMLSLTWRTGLANLIDKETGIREYNEDFKNSNYFKFLNRLINDKKLLKVLAEKEYKIRFIPHPNVLSQLRDFDLNEFVEIEDKDVDYQKEFCTNKILITDYSSVFFDFGYLKKPIIYYQEDKEEFYKDQLYDKGYFDYEKMGFGPAYEEYDKFIEDLINTINNDCILAAKYEKKINEFFTFNDNKNCERVYKEIKNLK